MRITIRFFKNDTREYEPACREAACFEHFTQKGEENTLVLNDAELRKKPEAFRNFISLSGHWAATEYYLDDEETDLEKMLQLAEVLNCEKSCAVCGSDCAAHCGGNNGWGCRQLLSIFLNGGSFSAFRSKRSWYDFGHFEKDVWRIDKDRIIEALQEEARTKMLAVCRNYSADRVRSVVDSLPDEIEVCDGGDWQYKYRDVPAGMPQTEIIGVRPRAKLSGNLGLPASAGSHSEGKQDGKEIPETTFEDIGGIDEIVRQVREVIELPLIAPQLFEHYHIKPHKGILLYGPPGCGKTLIAKAVAHEINAHFISVNGPEILNKYMGQSEANLRNIFEEAQAKAPSVIYFDEFDSIAGSRDAEGNPLMATVVNQLLTLMDGVKPLSKICCIASTNRIDLIDSAVKRPGRFDYVIEIRRPSPEGCKSIFRIHTAKMPVDPSFDRDAFVEEQLIGCTGAEIAFVAAEAAYNSIRRTVDIPKLFAAPDGFTVSVDNIIIESDFITAAESLRKCRCQAED